MSFMEAALGSGAVPLIAIDGPVAEIKRHIRMAVPSSWADKTFPYMYSLGFGIRPLTTKKHDYEPTDQFIGQDGCYAMLEWLDEIGRKAIDQNRKTKIWLFVFDLGKLKEDVTMTSMLAHLSDTEGPLVRTSTSIILCGPGIIHDLPPELSEQTVKLRCPYPSAEEIKSLLVSVYTAGEEQPPDKKTLDRLAREAAGMTSAQVANLGARSIYEFSGINDQMLREEVQEMMADLPGVSLLDTTGFTMDTIGGYDAVKNSMLSLINAYDNKPLVAPKGICLFGPPGTGKTALARVVGNEVGWKVILVSPSEFKDKYVGETGKNMSKLIALAEAVAPCILVLDEVDGAFGSSSGAKESDTSGDMLTILLTWMSQPRKKPVFMVATCNRLDKLPPEFSRAGRFDKKFFMDVPGAAAKDKIWQHYTTKYNLGKWARPNDEDWTGAEIETCCQIAYIEDVGLEDAGKQIVPIVSQMGEGFLTSLRKYASTSCLDSETGQRVKFLGKGAAVPPPPPPPLPMADAEAGGKTIQKKKKG